MDSYRYLILAEGDFGPLSSKTANSAIRYLPDRVVGVVDSTQAGKTVQDVLGFGGDLPIVSSFEEGLKLEPNALLVGIAPTGGQLPDSWRPLLQTVLEAELPIVSGLHLYLSDDPELASFAASRQVPIHDLRKPPRSLPISSGKAGQVDSLVVHTIGTDCNIGKMTAALQIRESLEARGTSVAFAPTGQTGILIEGWGISVDAVVADFIGGAAEWIVLHAAEKAEIVLVEGQGSLVHPGYSGVTLGLLHGSMPDAMILCHQPSRLCAYGAGGGYEWLQLPSVPEMIRICENAIAPLRESRVIGVALNTSDLSEEDARKSIEMIADATGLPTTDPVRYDPAPLTDAVLKAAEEKKARLAAPV